MAAHSKVCDLQHGHQLAPTLIGAKAATLARLLEAGERVPPGFVVLPDFSARRAAAVVVEQLGDGPFAVRSSAPFEDGERESHAGRHLSVLNVVGPRDLAHEISRVRASGDPPIPVLVMTQLQPDAAGVAFSANPITGADGVLIDAVPGLGDSLTSGAIDPERWKIADGEVSSSAADALDDAMAGEIAALARRTAHLLGGPQDIEWAICDGVLYLLQARPITALPRAPEISVPSRQTWIREDVHFSRPLRTLEFDALLSRMDFASRKVFAEVGYPMQAIEHRSIGGWPYVRMVPLHDTGRDPVRAPSAFAFGLAVRLVPSLRRRLRRASGLLDSDWARRQTESWIEQKRPRLRARTAALRAVDRASLDNRSLAGHVDAVLTLLRDACVNHVRMTAVMNMEVGSLGVFCRRHLGWEEAEVASLLQGHSVVSAQLGRAIVALAGRPADEAALASFLHQHGHQLLDFDLSQPSFAESPDALARIIERFKDHSGTPPDELTTAADRRVEVARLTLSSPLRHAFEELLARARACCPMGDDSELNIREALAVLRYAALEAGRRLFVTTDDVLWLRAHELTGALRGDRTKADISQRKAEYRWALANPGPAHYGPPPPDSMPSLRWVPSWSRSFFEIASWLAPRPSTPASGEGDTLVGLPGSAGTAEGVARVIRSASELQELEPGDIIVCSAACAAWSSMFPLAGAVVTQHGGVLSHPAILAREFGIPAVLNVPSLLEHVRDGQRLLVDGARGIVRKS